MGSWAYTEPRLHTTLKKRINIRDFKVRYCGRNPSGAVAAGSKSLHLAEEDAFLKDVFQQS
ncbi:BPK_HP2_G0024620.mRNA.1.CDS.1 [Saccharomyces cerevisiae]|nr:BPK_HP2_G0024620.mRNA.1.CDS.1 [Saccharomyces cerevisiae]CAI6452849.1 BPK_HP2_G0024620.mRNA.1.CDS.1 [Saccharomyces cerevisiae]